MTYEIVWIEGRANYYMKKQVLILGKLMDITIYGHAEHDSSNCFVINWTTWRASKGAWEKVVYDSCHMQYSRIFYRSFIM